MSNYVRWLVDSASDIYDEVEFKTDALFNEPAPEPWVAFMIGGILSAVGIVYWVLRVKRIRGEMISLNVPFVGSVRVRALISAAIDADNPMYTIIKMGAQSFLFLGGLQLRYQLTFTVMLIYFAVESSGDTLRILLGFIAADNLQNVVVTSSGMKSKVRNKTQLQPTNVYEDLSRDVVIVLMVFITQCILISFVITDIYESETTNCKDGTSGCPVVGTFGSWSFYVLGIFMACVFLLGPKTAFGQSEQNPAYWLKLLVAGKTEATRATWYDPHQDKACSRKIMPSDYRIWIRFIMSFLVNGVGFHVLVHALPIQVASQSSLTGTVFRAVGMMYLVDLDDTPGYKLTIVTDDPEEETEEEEQKEGGGRGNKRDEALVIAGIVAPDKDDDEEAAQETIPQDPQVAASQKFHHEDHKQSNMDVAAEADKIIKEAKAQLDALNALALKQTQEEIPKQRTEGALAMAGAVPEDNMMPEIVDRGLDMFDESIQDQQNGRPAARASGGRGGAAVGGASANPAGGAPSGRGGSGGNIEQVPSGGGGGGGGGDDDGGVGMGGGGE